MATILKGAPVAAALTEKLAQRALALKEKSIMPTLAIVRVGEKPADLAYGNAAGKRCDKVGIAVKKAELPQDVSQPELLDAIRQLNEDDTVHGILVFRPLPRPEDEAAVREILKPEKTWTA